jgi:hypothetical protein
MPSTRRLGFARLPPPFKEQQRGEELKRLFTSLGLQNVRADKAAT